jgi:hypothetical protein
VSTEQVDRIYATNRVFDNRRRDRESFVLMVRRSAANSNDRTETRTRSAVNWRAAGIASPITSNPKVAMRGDADGDAGDRKSVRGPYVGAKISGSTPAVPTHGLPPVVLAVPDRRQAGHTPFSRGPLVSSSLEALDNSVLKGNTGG